MTKDKKTQPGAILTKNDYGRPLAGIVIQPCDSPHRAVVVWLGEPRVEDGQYLLDIAAMDNPRVENLAYVRNCRYQGNITGDRSRTLGAPIALETYREWLRSRMAHWRDRESRKAAHKEKEAWRSTFKRLQRLPRLAPEDYPETA